MQECGCVQEALVVLWQGCWCVQQRVGDWNRWVRSRDNGVGYRYWSTGAVNGRQMKEHRRRKTFILHLIISRCNSGKFMLSAKWWGFILSLIYLSCHCAPSELLVGGWITSQTPSLRTFVMFEMWHCVGQFLWIKTTSCCRRCVEVGVETLLSQLFYSFSFNYFCHFS